MARKLKEAVPDWNIDLDGIKIEPNGEGISADDSTGDETACETISDSPHVKTDSPHVKTDSEDSSSSSA